MMVEQQQEIIRAHKHRSGKLKNNRQRRLHSRVRLRSSTDIQSQDEGGENSAYNKKINNFIISHNFIFQQCFGVHKVPRTVSDCGMLKKI